MQLRIESKREKHQKRRLMVATSGFRNGTRVDLLHGVQSLRPLISDNREVNMIREHEIPSAYITEHDEFTAKTIATLNDLIETCQDGHEGFREAAEGASGSDLKTLFMKYSNERAAYSSELQDLVKGLGGTPEHSGSLTAALHRGWMDIKDAIAGNDDAAILNECERGEDSAKKAYQEALKTELPDYVRTAVQAQYDTVLVAHDHIKSLRDSFRGDKANTAKPVL